MTYDIGTARGVIEMVYNGRGVRTAVGDLTTLEGAGTRTAKVIGATGKAFLGFGFGVATTLAFALKRAADFEKQMSGIAAVSGANAEQLDALRGKALQLGADTAFTASEAAAAMEELVKAGLSVDDVLNGAADAAVALAAAGGISIPEAATIAANSMNQFNMTASEMGHAVDVIAGAANASAIDVGDLGMSLKQVGAVANLAGMSFEDTATAIALMGNAGIRGSDAGTSLKTMLQNLQPTTTKQIDLFTQLGLLTEDGANKFFDAEGNVKSFAQVSGVLAKALDGQTNQQKLLNLETLFGTDAIRAAAIAADAGAKGVNSLNKEMNKTTAAEVAAKRMDNFSGSLDQLGGSIETALILSLSGVLAVMRDVVDGMTSGINKSVELGGVLADKLGPGFEDIVAAIGNVLSAVGDAIDIFDGLALAIVGLGLEAVIFVFTVLAHIIKEVTDLIDGQGEVVAIVAGAWLLMANGGLAQVIARLGYLAAYAIVRVIDGLLGMQARVTAANFSLRSLAATARTAAASLAAVGAIVAAIVMWQDYKKAIDDTDEALKRAQEAKDTGDFSAMQEEVDTLRKMIKERQAAIDEFGQASSWNPADMLETLGQLGDPGNWEELLGVKEYKKSMGDIKDSSLDLEVTLDRMGNNVVDLAESFGLIEPEDAQKLMDAFSEGDPAALEKMDALIKDFGPLLDQAGISTSDFMAALKADGGAELLNIVNALRQVTDGADGAQSATQSLSDAAREFGNEAMTAADKADALKAALDNLIGVELSADEATIAWHEGLRDLTAGLDKTSGAIKGNSKEADANRTLIINSTKDILDRVHAEAKAGTSIGRITKMFRGSRKELIDTAVAAGVNRDEMIKLLETYNFTPEAVRTIVKAVGAEEAQKMVQDLVEAYNITPEEKKTIFEASGADTAREKVKALNDYITDLHGKDAKIDVPGADKSKDMIKELRDQIEALKGKDAPIGTPGAAESEARVKALKAAIDALRNKDVTITTFIRRVTTGGADPNPDVGLGGLMGGSNGRSSTGGGATPRSVVPDGMTSPAPRSPSGPLVGTMPRTPAKKRGGSKGRLRMLDGELRLDESGRAFISGVAVDADDDDDDFDDTLGRMN